MDDTVRQAPFSYAVVDTQTSTDKKLNNVEYSNIVLSQIAPYLAETQQGMINGTEILNTLASAYDQENPSKLLVQPEQQGVINEPIPPAEAGIDQNAEALAEQDIPGGEEILL